MLTGDKVTSIYCSVDDLLKMIGYKEPSGRQMSDSEVITTALVSTLYFGGRQDNARGFMSLCGFVPDMLSKIQYIQPGRPMQNGYIERFNRTFRESILDAYLFEDTQQVQILAEEWIQDYNYRRPHESLGGKTPMEYDALPAACYQ